MMKETIEASLPQLRKTNNVAGIKLAQKGLQTTEHAISELEMTNTAAPMRAMVLEDVVHGHDSPLFIRGEAGNLGEKVPRRFLQLLSGPVRRCSRTAAAGWNWRWRLPTGRIRSPRA